MFENVQIYVLHHPLLIDRKDYFSKQLSRYNLTAEWVEGFAPESIPKPVSKYTITPTVYSLYLKHEYALKNQIKNNFKYALVFEDDALLGDNFTEYFDTIFKEFQTLQCDLLMIGTAIFPDLNLTVRNILPNKHVYYDPTYTTRCTHAILYTLEAAKKVVDGMQENPNAYDHKLNEIIIEKEIKTCWVEPGLLQGSRPDTPTTHLWHTSLR